MGAFAFAQPSMAAKWSRSLGSSECHKITAPTAKTCMKPQPLKCPWNKARSLPQERTMMKKLTRLDHLEKIQLKRSPFWNMHPGSPCAGGLLHCLYVALSHAPTSCNGLRYMSYFVRTRNVFFKTVRIQWSLLLPRVFHSWKPIKNKRKEKLKTSFILQRFAQGVRFLRCRISLTVERLLAIPIVSRNRQKWLDGRKWPRLIPWNSSLPARPVCSTHI